MIRRQLGEGLLIQDQKILVGVVETLGKNAVGIAVFHKRRPDRGGDGGSIRFIGILDAFFIVVKVGQAEDDMLVIVFFAVCAYFGDIPEEYTELAGIRNLEIKADIPKDFQGVWDKLKG